MLRSKTHIKRKGAFFSVLVAIFLLGIGAVVAFNSEQFNFANLFNLGAHQVEYKEDFVSPPDWKPCDVTPKTVITTNKSATPIKVRLSYDEFWRNKTDTGNLPLENNGIPLAIINFQNEADWTLQGGWYYYNYDLEPGQSTSSLFESVALNCEANFGSLNTCTETETGTVCTEVENPYEDAKYHLSITVQTSSGDFNHEGEHYAVTIDPNGGKYNDNAEIYTAQVDYGTVIDLSSATYVGYDLENWTLNNSETYTDSSITVTSDINLKANWVSSTWYTVTINPNGGTFENHTEAYDTPVRQGGNFTLSETEPTREGYLFEGWFIDDNTPLESNTFAVNADITFTAKWGLITAQNNRTGKLYTSLTSAESEAQSGDTITLLRNTEETFVNGKNITLDLGDHVLSGSIANNGTLTLLNGEVNNPDGTAVTNNGSLTMGINDYIDENTVNIESTAIRLIGTTTGLKQNGTFNYYDGFIEGDIALEGGYNDSPFYRKTFDDEEVHFFPFVDKSPDNNTRQRVILESSDLAVSKTKVGGDIYYYSLQDNINTSVRTGYKIFIAREDWSTGEPITVPEDTDIAIDLEGHTFTATDTITINGKLTLEDSETTIETVDVADNSTAMPSINGKVFVTPHTDNTTTTVTYAGKISTPQTTIINGELLIKNALISSTTTNDTIKNNSTLRMQNGAIGASVGYITKLGANETYSLDHNSYLFSTSTNNEAIKNELTNYVWNSDGIIYAAYTGIQSTNNTTFTFNRGTIKAEQYGIKGSTVIINNGSILIDNHSNRPATGVSSDNVTMYNGSIRVISAATGGRDCGYVDNQCVIGIDGKSITVEGGSINAISTQGRPYTMGIRNGGNYMITVDGGSISATGVNGTTRGISGHSTINGGTITATSTGAGDAVSVRGYAYSTTINDGVLTATGTGTGSIYGVFQAVSSSSISTTGGPLTVNNGVITAHSENGTACGAYMSHSVTKATIKNGTISGYSTNGTSYGLYSYEATITSGTIQGGTYGIYANNSTVTIGTNSDPVNIEIPEITGGNIAIHNGSFKFYDGILHGGTKAYTDGQIKAIPDGMTYHVEQSAQYDENCWLVPAAEYLEIEGVGRFRSLQQAYDAITGNSGTIKVVEDVTVEAVLPASPSGKDITFDLNGHQLIYTQPLINGGTMTIVNGDPDKAGSLHNPNTAVSTITNNGTLTIESGNISSANIAISSTGPVTVNGGKITGSITGISNSSNTSLVINSGTIEAGQYGVQNGNVAMNGGTITVNNTAGRPSAGINASQATMYDGSISVTSTAGGPAECGKVANQCITGIEASTITVKGGSIYAKSVNNGPYTRGLAGTSTIDGGSITVTGASTLYGATGNTTINNGNITVTGTNMSRSYEAVGIIGSISNTTAIAINGGTITVNNTGGVADGFQINNTGGTWPKSSTARITGGTITAHSATGIARGGYGSAGGDNSRGIIIVTGGTISGSSDSNTSYGLYGKQNSVDNATISGETYGIYTTSNGETILGNSANAVSITTPEITGGSYALYNGAVKYYDGILHGGTKAYQDGIIKAIPDGKTYHIEESASYLENCWLVNAAEYLEVVGVGRFNSLAQAYDAITGDTGTIKVVESVTVEATLPSSPAGKNITFDLNGNQLIYTQSLTNGGTMTIIDSDPNKAGRLHNPNTATSAITNNGTLTIESGYISSANIAVNNANALTINGGKIIGDVTGIKSSSNNNSYAVTLNDGTIEAGQYGITNGTITVNGGSITVNNTAGRPSAGIEASTVTMNDGSISVTSSAGGPEDCTKVANQCITGIEASTITVKGGSIYAKSVNNGPYTRGLAGTSTIDGGSITVTGASTLYGANGNTTMNGGSITVTGTNTSRSYEAVGIIGGVTNGTGFTINDGTINVTNTNGVATGFYIDRVCHSWCYTTTAYVNGGTITAHSENGVGRGGFGSTGSDNARGIIRISGGTISGSSGSSTSYGIYGKQNTVNNAVISGGTYGIYTITDGETILGNSANAVSITTPEITGGSYALYNGAVKYYDGVLRGGTKAYQDNIVKEIAENVNIHLEYQTIDGISYDTRWLAPEYDVAQIVGGSRYKKLSEAIENVPANGTIELVADNYIFPVLNIPTDKEFTLDTKGFSIFLGNHIVNNGNTSIINNTTDTIAIYYHETDYAIVNNENATLSIDKLSLDCYNGIQNSGTMTITGASIDADNIAIRNIGNMSAVNNLSIKGDNYPIYTDGGALSVSNATITGNYIYDNSGELELINSTTSKSGNTIQDFITNKGTMKLNTFEATLVNEYPSSSSTVIYPRVLYNTGTLITSNNSVIKHTGGNPNSTFWQNIIALYNDGGNVQASDTTFEANGATSNSRSTTRYSYGIYNPTGTVSIASGKALARDIVTSYGIWNGSGTIIIGTPEPTSSPNYGRENADVSITEPEITAIATNNSYSGIGVKNASGGRVEYYDGKISGNTAAFAEEPTVTEHFYEVCTELDTSTTPNLYTAKLFWMRDGQSTCANN